jgi:hypothetical protein
MAKKVAKDKEVIDAKVAKRKQREDESIAEASKAPKKKKAMKRNITLKTPDPDMVKFVREIQFLLELMAQHGASLGMQTKRAVQAVYQMGKDYQKARNPALATAHLSHAMVVIGCLGSVKCEKLIIDPGSSTMILDVQKAHEAGIGITKGLKYLIQMANRDLKALIGETAICELITVKGVKV